MVNPEKRAYIFDLNGTMINDMDFHIRAWHQILSSLGASLSIEQVKQECYGKNEELLERIFPGRFSYEQMQEMIWQKETGYQEVFRPHLKLIDGLDVLLENSFHQNIAMGIGSAALPMNINYVLDGLQIRKYFSAIVSAVDVTVSKPDPETFLLCAKQLGVLPENCIVFEDSPKGVQAAENAGMKSVVLTTMHPPEDFANNPSILLYIPDYTSKQLAEILMN